MREAPERVREVARLSWYCQAVMVLSSQLVLQNSMARDLVSPLSTVAVSLAAAIA